MTTQISYETRAGREAWKIEVDADETSDPIHPFEYRVPASGVTIAAFPGEGGTATVQYTLSQKADVEADNANWVNWDDGAASADTVSALISPVTALRFAAATAAAVFEVTA